MRERPAMLELRLSIISINPGPTNLAANEVGFMGWLAARSFTHRATTGPDDQHSRRRVRQAAI
jgi:hypothetical protein